MVGRAVHRRLTAAGWRVDAVARRPRDPVGEVCVADRHDPVALAAVVGAGADLLVDCLCYTAADAASLLPLLGDVSSTVVLSARAVYVDEAGNHVNSDEPPRFAGPVTEKQPTVAPSYGDDYDSRFGYAACKVAAEQVLLGSGRPVTVLRAAKVHGAGAARPVSAFFVDRALAGDRTVPLAHPEYAEHLSAAENVARLVAIAAARPDARILNVADADAPTLAEAALLTARRLGHRWRVVPDPSAPGRPGWGAERPVRLDLSAARALGYRPATFAATVPAEIDWLRTAAQVR